MGGAQPHAKAPPHEDGEERDDRQGADEPELLTDDGEDEVRVRLRQVEELLLRLADAAAQEAAATQRQPRLDDLKSAAARIAPRVEERRDAAQPIGREPDGQWEERQRRADDEAQV